MLPWHLLHRLLLESGFCDAAQPIHWSHSLGSSCRSRQSSPYQVRTCLAHLCLACMCTSEHHQYGNCRLLLQQGRSSDVWGAWAGRQHLTNSLFAALATHPSADLIPTLLIVGATLESTSTWRTESWERHYLWDGTPLFKAASLAHYDNVQMLVWLGASLQGQCMCYTKFSRRKARSLPEEHMLASHLTPATYRWACRVCRHHHKLAGHPVYCLDANACRLLQELDGREMRAFPQNGFPILPSTWHRATLAGFRLAVEAGLISRRLLVMSALSRQVHLVIPVPLLQHIFALAELLL